MILFSNIDHRREERPSMVLPASFILAYADIGSSGTVWVNSEGNRPDHTVTFEGESSIVSSKRWEAWRDGVEEHKLLLQAKRKSKQAKGMMEFERRVAEVLEHPDDYPSFKETRRFLLAIASR